MSVQITNKNGAEEQLSIDVTLTRSIDETDLGVETRFSMVSHVESEEHGPRVIRPSARANQYCQPEDRFNSPLREVTFSVMRLPGYIELYFQKHKTLLYGDEV
jgi:hypothetical protein